MYKSSGELKRQAKDSLRGRWKEAVMLNLVPSIIQMVSMFFVTMIIIGLGLFIGLVANDQSNFSKMMTPNYEKISDGDDWDESYMWEEEFDDESPGASAVAALTSATSAPLVGPIFSFVMTFLTIGISFTFLDVIRRGKSQEMSFKQSFRLFNGNDFVPVLLINILTYIFQYLWFLLFIIPGIVKGYSYSQANFIYKDLSSTRDTRSMGATSFITESRELMDGHKGRLFWLDISFIGWYIVGLLTMGIGLLWINPYINATKAAFYDDLSKGKFLEEEVIEDDEIWTSF
ncbi:DUF975 family protein [Vagococcus bubulae]|uniref:DUF975 domain-containing protein n=1 Tax=Vagococcus bubulae TaxID=1977868 RepID=A0A429ZAK4_9ENTE|nr:DUF975 family protein [Vagococcus bubulae]RST90724.1 hypothetical protein CBF36_11080 [Vagococcus bubulae]